MSKELIIYKRGVYYIKTASSSVRKQFNIVAQYGSFFIARNLGDKYFHIYDYSGNLLSSNEYYDIASIGSAFKVYTRNTIGVVDNKFNIILEPIYSRIALVNDMFECELFDNPNKEYFNQEGVRVEHPKLIKHVKTVDYITNIIDDLIISKLDNKSFLLSNDKIVIQPIYNDIKIYKRAILCYGDDGIQILNRNYQEITPTLFKDVTVLEELSQYIVRNIEGFVGVIDHSGDCIIPLKYEEIDLINLQHKLYTTSINGHVGLYKYGQEIIEPKYDTIEFKSNYILCNLNNKIDIFTLI